MKIWDAENYKTALKAAMNRLQESDPRANLRRLAEACRIQKTYLSRVMNRDGHLNADQLHLAANYLELAPCERKYITLLHEADRSALAPRKDALLREAARLRAKALSTENYLSAETLRPGEPDASRYYLDPLLQLIHLFLTIPRYAKDPKAIQGRLDLSRDELEDRLATLSKLGLARYRTDQKRWIVVKELLHLSRDSAIYPYYRVLVRTKAMERLQKSVRRDDYSYSLFFSADARARKLVQERFLEFLKSIEPVIRAAPATDVYQLGFDLLSWSAD